MTALNKAFCKENCARKFDEKIKVHRQGRDILVDEWIQAGKEETNIYDVMKKYGIGPDEAANQMGIAGLRGILEDVSKIKSLQDVFLMNKAANESWSKLSSEIRAKFNNNRKEFAINGENWLKNEIKNLQQQQKVETKE